MIMDETSFVGLKVAHAPETGHRESPSISFGMKPYGADRLVDHFGGQFASREESFQLALEDI